MRDFPEQDELVIVNVKKIMPYGAFCSLDEYEGIEGFLHISQVSSGWVRNIREHLREGQKLVCKVHAADAVKAQVDLSLRAVSDADRKRKLEAYQTEKKSRKLIEVAGARLKKTPLHAWREAGEVLLREYGSLYAGLEAIREGDNKAKLPQAWVEAISEVVEKEFKPKRVRVRAKLALKFVSSDGVAKLRDALQAIEALSEKKAGVRVHYLGAPNYFVDVEASDYKTAEKTLGSAEEILKSLPAQECEYSLEQERR